WLLDHHLQIACEKTEAVMIVGKKKWSPVNISVTGHLVDIKSQVKYLGVILDKHLTFIPHVQYITTKASNIVNGLSRIMPNIGGPSELKRRLPASVAESVILYSACAWGHAAPKYKKNKTALR